MLFTDLNTKVLLDIFGYLDLIDAINLAGTCTKIRDAAQLHYTVRYKVFNLNDFLNDRDQVQRHNYVDATVVLKAIGHVISVLVTDLDEGQFGSDLGAAIQKYCVNVKSLKIAARNVQFKDCSPCTSYYKWLKNLKLEKITLGVSHIKLLDLSKTSTLNELLIIYNDTRYPGLIYLDNTFAPHVMKRIFERNHNITRFSIPLFVHFDYEIFVKLTSLKCVRFSRISQGALSKVAAKLEMCDLERVEIADHMDNKDLRDVNAFLGTLAEKAPKLNELSLDFALNHPADENPFDSLRLFELTSLKQFVNYLDFHKELPKMQPSLKHLDLFIYHDVDPAQQIISLIQNLKKLEIFHINIGMYTKDTLAVLKALKEELGSNRILNAHSINRPALQIYMRSSDGFRAFVRVKVSDSRKQFRFVEIQN